jgi:hypothetical protein
MRQLDAMKVNARQRKIEPYRLPVTEEVDLMAARG